MQLSLQKVLKTSKKRLNKFKKLKTPLLFIFVGIFLFSIGLYNYYKVRVLSFSGKVEAAQEVSERDSPVQVIIPSIKVDIVVDPGQIKEGVWDISYKNATYLASSGAPGSGGNTVIYGHNKTLILGNLPYLSLGQKIIVKTKSGKTFEYEAYQKDFVGPDRIDLVSPTDHEELTLFTCWGLFDSQRVIVKARPI